jgi:hypothetical protein
MGRIAAGPGRSVPSPASGRHSAPPGPDIAPEAVRATGHAPARRAGTHQHPRVARPRPPAWASEGETAVARGRSRLLRSERSVTIVGVRRPREDGDIRPRAASRRSSLTMRSRRDGAVKLA